ncbi:WXG100 family type VII secretion target [Nocardia sp. NPDC052566]|uniref:WXG100 family type VII secretion target n=1 Tax=Nocardia sp. NPDC052566 TaxID=3364330 RepID=UPI0037C835E9
MTGESNGADPLQVIPEQVKDLGRYAYGIATELRSGSNSLDGEVRGLLETWKGGAADSYGAGWDEMHQGAVRVWDVLFALAEKLGITAENYRTTDTGSASGISSLGGLA